MESTEHRLELVQQEGERLGQYLSGLASSAWTRPSACDRWEVRDVVAHLASGADFYHSSISRGLRGDSSPPPGLPPPGVAGAAASADRIAQMAVSLRENTGDQLLSTFKERNERLNQLLTGILGNDWNKLCYHPAAAFPVWVFVNLRLTELAMHAWDIRSGLEPGAHLPAGSLQTFMDLIPGFATRWGFRPSSRLPQPIRYRFDVTGAELANNEIVVEGDSCHMEPAGAAAANVTFGCDAKTLALIIYGRLRPDAATATGRLAIEGDRGLVAEFGRWFGGA